MPQIPHSEHHFTGSATVRDLVIGMADGLTVPFALAAGLSGAVDTTRIIVTAGLAEIAAGAIAMGLGGYLAAQSEAEHYHAERQREVTEVTEKPEAEVTETAEVFRSYGVTEEESRPIVDALRTRPEAWVDFMMRFELGLEQPDPRRAVVSALTIAGAYIAGGCIPLGPYMLLATASAALGASVALTLMALGMFGYVKGHFTGTPPWRSAMQTVLIGGLPREWPS
jgi:vacuolar iron transporter family protein